MRPASDRGAAPRARRQAVGRPGAAGAPAGGRRGGPERPRRAAREDLGAVRAGRARAAATISAASSTRSPSSRGSGAWREARRRLDGWNERTSALLDEAERILRANRAPIESRNQFRALLDAYQVKAKPARR